MSKKHPNPCLAKIHRNYTVEEIAILYGKHKHTVRSWVKDGLPIIDKQRPMLILGYDLRAFLKARREKNKRPCKPGQFYCVKCRVPKFPMDGVFDCKPVNETIGNLEAICPDCDSIMNQLVSLARIEEFEKIWASHYRKHCDT
ncbi:MAG: helix-turn-helix domain-containing protein [Thermodesulfobacteriota bacterium]